QQRREAIGVNTPLTCIQALLAAGFADRLAQRRGHSARYQLANGIGAMLDEHDGLSRYEWLIAPSLLQGASSADAR
ncbi:hypothetical protein QM327_22215, partial [Pantoea dispersa]|uniref:hypothetical protein n=1 Tax=Pantoea dispersa TaxID=59814 RepID=UPI0024B7E8FE